jgi:hypothetical protein
VISGHIVDDLAREIAGWELLADLELGDPVVIVPEQNGQTAAAAVVIGLGLIVHRL